MSVKVGVLALQGSFLEHIKSLERMKLEQRFEHLDITVVEIRTAEEVTENLRGLIIPGGESTTLLRFLDDKFLAKIKTWLEVFRRPVWGSCAGMILLADQVKGIGALDAVVIRNYFGRQRQSFVQKVSLTTDTLIRGGSPHYPGVFIRAPLFQHIGRDVEVLATLPSGTGDDQIVAVRQGNVVATAFHPELTADDRFHAFFMELVSTS